MSETEEWTAERFAEQRDDLPDAGRWMEVVGGALVTLAPPDEAHGNVVRNLATAIARMVQEKQQGYACFELGLIVNRNPDTVRTPAISFFVHGEMFAEQDKIVTETVPAAVIEIASTNDRRRTVLDKAREYLDWGVPFVGVIDPVERKCHSFQVELPPMESTGDHKCFHGGIFGELSLTVDEVFVDPKWWR